MMNRLLSLMAIAVLLGLILGCSGGGAGNSPVLPSTTDDTQPGLTENTDPGLTGATGDTKECDCGHRIWGLWQGEFNPVTGSLDIVQLREAQFHLNVTTHLQAPMPQGLKISMNDFDPVAGLVDIDLTITHPFPGSNFRGFDVRGILMGAGDLITGNMDPTLKYPAPDGFRVLNADGYTRWWNPQEFTTEGMYGFTPGDLGMATYKPMATLNGYKYYSDALMATDPVVPNVSLTNRGTFSSDMTPPELTRNYKLQFPIGGNGKPIWLFQYAIDANWAPPTGSSSTPKPIDDFPIEANCPEAFHLEIDTTGSTAYYVDDTNNGGDITLAIEVFDWGASTNPDGVAGEVAAVRVESATLFGGIVGAGATPDPGSQPVSGIYTINIPDVTPTGLDNQEVLITVWSAYPTTYEPPVPGPVYPMGATLAAYQIVTIPVADEPPVTSITVTSPNGGEEYDAGSSTDVTWDSTGPVGAFVKIEYSITGTIEGQVTASTANDGEFEWNPIPDIDSEEVKVVVTSLDDPLIFDESDEYFSVLPVTVPQIIITAPNGGEIWESGGAANITWESYGDVGFEVRIEYTVDDGPPVILESFTDNDGLYQWIPLPDVESEMVKVIVTDTDNDEITDQSDDYFTITNVPPPQIIVDVPNGGEVWESGTAEDIEWSIIGDTGSEVRIEYTISDGLPTAIIDQTNNDGTFTWDPIPDLDSDEVKIVVTSFVFPMITDESDDFFEVKSTVEPTLEVLIPNGGEVWLMGSSETVTWSSTGDVGDFVKLDLEISDSLVIPIVDSTKNDGEYLLDPVPDVISNELRVIVTSIDHPTVTDESDAYFSIELVVEPTLTVLIPNGGEVWPANGSKTITWASVGDVGDWVAIAYKISDSIETEITGATENDGSFTWDPIPDIESVEVRIVIRSNEHPGVWDQSDEYFEIAQDPPEVMITIPNGGEVWEFDSSHDIEWTSANLTGQVRLEYTLFDGDTPKEIVAATDDTGSFEWNPIPLADTFEARVIITSIDFPAATDASDDYFIITEPTSITLTSPNGGEELAAGGSWEITWIWTSEVDFVNILFSIDSGGSYPASIVDGTLCDGSFIWDPIPGLDTTTARIKIEWATNPLVNDESDANFTISDTGPLPGWNPVVGQTQVAMATPAPNQGAQPADIAVFSLGDNQSVGQIMDETGDNYFNQYTDDYTATTGVTWQYPTLTAPVHKFDVLPDGSVLFVTNANTDTFPNEIVNDPTHSAYSGNDNSDGTFIDGSWHLYGDIGDAGTGDPDPDEAPWRHQVDFSCGVTGGVDDTTSYHLNVISMVPGNPQPHDGNIILGRWTSPFDAPDALKYWFIDSSTQGGGTGPVDDTDPDLMAIGVDDGTDLVFDTDPVIAHWIVCSNGIVICHMLGYTDGSLVTLDDYLDDGDFGAATPVDVEVAPAKEFDYQVTDPGFNWVCVLLDNGDGTWSVGIWEPMYIDDPFAFTLIDITSPLPGTPMALDIDGTDFEIHVLADNGGTVEATVFYYLPE